MKDILENCLFFSYLTPDQLDLVIEKLDRFPLAHENRLFTEGDAGDFACFVLKGALEVVKTTSHGDSNIIATLVVGSSIGEMALVDGQPRSATVRSLGNTDLAILTKASFERMIEEQPQVSINILKGLAAVLSDNLRETSSLLTDEMR